MSSHGGFGGRPASPPLTPLVPTHPGQPLLFPPVGGSALGVKAPDDSYSEGAAFGTVLVKRGLRCLGFFLFLLKKEKIHRSVEVLRTPARQTPASYPYALTHA